MIDQTLEFITAAFLAAGVLFFLAGTLGLLRFPDVYLRLHAVTKADNVGLGLIITGLMFRAEDPLAVLELGAIWGLILVSATTAAHLVSRTALADDQEPWHP